MPRLEETDNQQPVKQPTTPVPVVPKLPLVPHVIESWNAAANAGIVVSSKSASNPNGSSSLRELMFPAVVKDGTLHSMLFFPVYTTACKCIFSCYMSALL